MIPIVSMFQMFEVTVRTVHATVQPTLQLIALNPTTRRVTRQCARATRDCADCNVVAASGLLLVVSVIVAIYRW